MRTGVPKAVDVAVIGGGPAGATTALLLARAGALVMILDKSGYTEQRVGETLPPVANKLLLDLDLWAAFSEQEHLPSHGTVSVWADEQLRSNDFFCASQGPGWNLDRNRFDCMLLDESRKAGAHTLLGTRILSCVRSERQGWKLSFRRFGATHHVGARYLVDATGRTGTAPLAFLQQRVVMDRQVGLGRFHRGNCSCRYTLVEAIDEGWFYSAGLPRDRLVVMYFTDADIYAQGRNNNPRYWEDQLAKAVQTSGRVKSAGLTENSVTMSAATGRRVNVVGNSWLAVGDAAHSFDPLSSLGIYKAMDSGRQACDVILSCLKGDSDDSEYRNWSDKVFNHYLRHRAAFYGRERRWPGSVFWQRRQAA